MDPLRKPIKQKKICFASKRQEAIKQEVEELLEVGFNRGNTIPWMVNKSNNG